VGGAEEIIITIKGILAGRQRGECLWEERDRGIGRGKGKMLKDKEPEKFEKG